MARVSRLRKEYHEQLSGSLHPHRFYRKCRFSFIRHIPLRCQLDESIGEADIAYSIYEWWDRPQNWGSLCVLNRWEQITLAPSSRTA